MSSTLLARNDRGTADVQVTRPVGLSALVGTNRAGKTTLGFVGDLLERATASARLEDLVLDVRGVMKCRPD